MAMTNNTNSEAVVIRILLPLLISIFQGLGFINSKG